MANAKPSGPTQDQKPEKKRNANEDGVFKSKDGRMIKRSTIQGAVGPITVESAVFPGDYDEKDVSPLMLEDSNAD
jgi:hypothetical protein